MGFCAGVREVSHRTLDLRTTELSERVLETPSVNLVESVPGAPEPTTCNFIRNIWSASDDDQDGVPIKTREVIDIVQVCLITGDDCAVRQRTKLASRPDAAYPHQPQKKRGVKPRLRDRRANHSPFGFQYLRPRVEADEPGAAGNDGNLPSEQSWTRK